MRYGRSDRRRVLLLSSARLNLVFQKQQRCSGEEARFQIPGSTTQKFSNGLTSLQIVPFGARVITCYWKSQLELGELFLGRAAAAVKVHNARIGR